MEDPKPIAALRVLASGSTGNCSVLLVRACGERRVCLIDAGISPRRVRKLLDRSGLSMDLIDAVLVTHLDHDHWQLGWGRALPQRAVVRLHRRHAAAARRSGLDLPRVEPFDGAFDLHPGIRVRPAMGSHDDQGVSAFRVDFVNEFGAASLGFATDLGHIADEFIDHMRAVEVMAIESNYCPRLQEASPRPWFLKRRIMGGSGHLSNEQCARAVAGIGPRSHVVLLHLSRDCNRPELAAHAHAGAPYALTLTHHQHPTPWVPIRAESRAAPHVQLPLFGTSRPQPVCGASL
jgi:phosphoribosyl 1,2-cyclic phosphodiesterase